MVSNLLKTFFGDKSSKDRKAYQPSIDQANAALQSLQNITDDELRAKTKGFQELVIQGTQELEDELKQLNEKANDLSTPIHEKEAIFEDIDKMTGTIDEKIEEILETIRPEAFAVVKETARRWAENGKLEVTAQDFDIELASQKDGIRIQNGKAIWDGQWTAAGAAVEWNMIHYDVQLMGGGVLHNGNIA
jgi:preprotein translocase subunit SecA